MIWQTGLWHVQLDTHPPHIYSRSSYHPTPGPHQGNVKDRASKQPELSPIWVQLKLQSPDGKHPQQTFANTKSHTTRTGTTNTPPTYQTALSYETAAPNGAGWRPKTPHGNAKARSFRCAGVPGRHERFRRRHPKAHPDFGITRSKDPGLERFVRLCRTSVLDSDPIICSLATELVAKNS